MRVMKLRWGCGPAVLLKVFAGRLDIARKDLHQLLVQMSFAVKSLTSAFGSCVEKDGLEITVDRGELIILGRRKPIEVTGEPIYREIRTHDFRRVYELDPSIDSTKISAKIDQGILTVTLPKAESVKPRKIAMQ